MSLWLRWANEKPTLVWGTDRQICPVGRCSASRGSELCLTVTRVTDLYIMIDYFSCIPLGADALIKSIRCNHFEITSYLTLLWRVRLTTKIRDVLYMCNQCYAITRGPQCQTTRVREKFLTLVKYRIALLFGGQENYFRCAHRYSITQTGLCNILRFLWL